MARLERSSHIISYIIYHISYVLVDKRGRLIYVSVRIRPRRAHTITTITTITTRIAAAAATAVVVGITSIGGGGVVVGVVVGL